MARFGSIGIYYVFQVKSDFDRILRGDIKIPLLHLVTWSLVTPLPHVRLKVTPGDDIQLLFPIHFSVFL